MTDLTTVYRASHRNAETDATALKNMLVQNGTDAVVVDIGNGMWEVRVPVAQAAEAAEWLAKARPEQSTTESDPSADYDFVPIATTDGATSEMEAISIQSILDANGVNCIIVGTTTLPNLGFEVRVPREDLERAIEILREAQAAGPAAAEEASQLSVPDQKGM
jgi:type III secretory pathway lipoprotein EscJ